MSTVADAVFDRSGSSEKPKKRHCLDSTYHGISGFSLNLEVPNQPRKEEAIDRAAAGNFCSFFQPTENTPGCKQFKPEIFFVSSDDSDDDDEWKTSWGVQEDEASNAKPSGGQPSYESVTVIISDDDDSQPYESLLEENSSHAHSTSRAASELKSHVKEKLVEKMYPAPRNLNSYTVRRDFPIDSTRPSGTYSKINAASTNMIKRGDLKDKNFVKEMGLQGRTWGAKDPPEVTDYDDHKADYADPKMSNWRTNSAAGIHRNKVKDAVSCFRKLYQQIFLQWKSKQQSGGIFSSQLQAKAQLSVDAAVLLKKLGKRVNTVKLIGHVPGIEIGDSFQFRTELSLVGLHLPYQCGIDYLEQNGRILATSIVVSAGYENYMESDTVLIYSGQGGRPGGRHKQCEDQKLERGNKALYNSYDEVTPVRVVFNMAASELLRPADSIQAESTNVYVYDGLYTVTRCQQVRGGFGKLVFRFRLERISEQPNHTRRQIPRPSRLFSGVSRQTRVFPTVPRQSNSRVRLQLQSKARLISTGRLTKGHNIHKIPQGLLSEDLSRGEETVRIRVWNKLDAEKSPQVTYRKAVCYPKWFNFSVPLGCDCDNQCSDATRCACALKNGGVIPFSDTGEILDSSKKPFVYECGPYCKCFSSCKNRVSQHGIRAPLEIFKTKRKGWGVRSRDHIMPGRFVCEYVGELVKEMGMDGGEIANDFAFCIGLNGREAVLPNETVLPLETTKKGFTIHAAEFGNVGRFINHSCSPNLICRFVLYDHDDKRIPHIMFFAAKKIPPRQELSYDYNCNMAGIFCNGTARQKTCLCLSENCWAEIWI